MVRAVACRRPTGIYAGVAHLNARNLSIIVPRRDVLHRGVSASRIRRVSSWSPNLLRVFSSSVGTKLLIGLTGLLLFVYLVLHLVGNALIFLGPDIFNEYSHTLISNPLIVPIEIGLLARVPAAHLQGGHDVDRATRRRARCGTRRRSRRAHQPQEPGLVHDDRLRARGPGLRRRPRQAVQVRHVLPGRRQRRRSATCIAPRSRSSSNPLWVAFYVSARCSSALHLRHGVSQRVPVARARPSALHAAARGVGHRRCAILIGGGLAVIPIWVVPDRTRLTTYRWHSTRRFRAGRWRTSGTATASSRSWSTRPTAGSTPSSSSAPAWPARRRRRRSASSATTS